MRRSKGIRRRNPKRAAKRFERDFGGADYRAYIVAMPCAMCGIEGYSEPAHAKSRGAGGDASDLVPLCGIRPLLDGAIYAGCHHLYDNYAKFHADRKERLRTLAKSLRRAWLNREEAE